MGIYLKEDQILEDGIGIAKAKFIIHRDKGDWEHKTLATLIEELKREISELEEASTKEEIILECGDLINYSCMIIDIVKRKGVK